jgi:hypothetical protein
MTPTPLPALDLHEPTPAPRPAEHYTQLWPTPAGQPANAPLFLLAVSPLRLLALGTLWATSSPGRFLISVVALALAAVLLIAL